MSSRLAYIGVVVIILIGIILAISSVQPPVPPAINSFEECIAAGYPVMESYPEQCKTPDGRTFVRVLAEQYSDLIQVDSPQPNGAIESPLTVTGKARGTWYFEASFPVTLLDGNGTVLVQAPAQAQGEWMTTEFVPFSVALRFVQPVTKTGTLVLHNDNPSGLPEHDKEVRIPITFTDPVVPRVGVFGALLPMVPGEIFTYAEGDVQVKLVAITDSRCPPDVQCVWQGELSAELLVSFDSARGIAPQTVRLGTVNDQTATLDGYVFTLHNALPTGVTLSVRRAGVPL